MEAGFSRFSKLPVRQFSGEPLHVASAVFSKLPVRQFSRT